MDLESHEILNNHKFLVNHKVKKILIKIINGDLKDFQSIFDYFESNNRLDYCELMIICLQNIKDLDSTMLPMISALVCSKKFANYP